MQHRHRALHVVIAVLALPWLAAAQTDVEEDMRTIKDRLRAHAAGPPPSNLEGLLEQQQADGHWPDIDYGHRGRARWAPSGHMGRVLALSQGYAGTRSAAGRDALAAAIRRGLDYWFEHDFQCPNWWYNTIGIPRQLYRIMLLVESELSPEQMAAGLRILERGRLGMTGQNLVWVAEITIARGCLAETPAVVRRAFDRMWQEIRIAGNEGIQPDMSFYQHGAQLYSGGYGRGFAVDNAHFAALAAGTAFACPPDKVHILSAYILDGEQWLIRGRRFDYSACGRELSRTGGGGASSFIAAARDMASLQTARRNEFAAFAERLEKGPGAAAPPLVGNRHFWRADIMVHHRPDYYASVRLTSPRLVQTETCNGENLLGAHLSDGLMYLYLTGDEYHHIFPVWNWQQLPGTTCEQRDQPPSTRNGARGERAFAGGVSNGHIGLCAMDFKRESLYARKAWFCLGDAVVCLGSAISCDSEFPVSTTLNQCLQNGPVYASAGGVPRMLSADTEVLEGACQLRRCFPAHGRWGGRLFSGLAG